MTPEFAAKIEAERPRLMAFLNKEASGLLRFESLDDIYQAVQLRALESARGFSDQGEEAFTGRLITLARRTIADRNDYWRAIKRDCGRLLRLSWSSSSGGTGGSRVVASSPGPSTWASRRELLILASRALAILGERDRDLIAGEMAGRPLSKVAESLEISNDAARKTRDRALERLRKTFQILISQQT